MEWILELFKTIIVGFNAIVDMLILIDQNIVNATSTLEVQNYGIIDNSTIIFKSIDAFRYVVGPFLFNTLLTLILFSISYATYTFIKEFKKLIWGDKGAIESTGIFSWISKFIKK